MACFCDTYKTVLNQQKKSKDILGIDPAAVSMKKVFFANETCFSPLSHVPLWNHGGQHFELS